jgi:hypothetical protein
MLRQLFRQCTFPTAAVTIDGYVDFWKHFIIYKRME